MWRDEKLESLDGCRIELNLIDSKILQLVKERMDICVVIGKLKAREGRAVCDPKREEQVYKTRQIWGAEHGMSSKFIRLLFKVMMSESKRRQRELLESMVVRSA